MKITFLGRKYPPPFTICVSSLDLITHFNTIKLGQLLFFPASRHLARLLVSPFWIFLFSMSARTSFHKFISKPDYMFRLMNLVYVSAITVRSTSREEVASSQDDYISDMTMLGCVWKGLHNETEVGSLMLGWHCHIPFLTF